MENKLTIQDLKNRKSYIIAKVAKLGLSEKLTSVMGAMKMEVEMGATGTIYELLISVTRVMTNRKETKLAEICGNGIKASGREVDYSITKYL